MFIQLTDQACKDMNTGLPELIPGKTDSDLFPEKSARLFQEDDRKIIRTGVWTRDFRQEKLFLDGAVRYVQTRGKIHNDSEKPVNEDRGYSR